MKKILEGKTAIITGSNQGLGLEIAKKYALAGANLMLCARDKELLTKALHEVSKNIDGPQKVIAQEADISNIEDVKKVVKITLNEFNQCHILVNNAGIYGPKGLSESVDWLDWIKTFEINVFGSVLMCRELTPHFKRQSYGKIIQLSGGGATNPMPRISAYAASKAAIVRFSETLADELREYCIDVNAIAPGALNTRMLDEILLAGVETVGNFFYEGALKQKITGGASMDHASDLALFLGSSKSDGISGKLISAIWDNWEQWPHHISELNKTDAYTLRRIVGADRNIKKWGDK
jgi:NAD(P)-dependent dehydrogenase (short-subunit alcohol dehydrogenase family)